MRTAIRRVSVMFSSENFLNFQNDTRKFVLNLLGDKIKFKLSVYERFITSLYYFKTSVFD